MRYNQVRPASWGRNVELASAAVEECLNAVDSLMGMDFSELSELLHGAIDELAELSQHDINKPPSWVESLYVYFVTFQDGLGDMNRCEVSVDSVIQSIEDVEQLEHIVKVDFNKLRPVENQTDVLLVDFKLLRTLSNPRYVQAYSTSVLEPMPNLVIPKLPNPSHHSKRTRKGAKSRNYKNNQKNLHRGNQ